LNTFNLLLKLIQVAVALPVLLGFNAPSAAQNLIRLGPGEQTFVRDMIVRGDCLNGGAVTYQTSGFEIGTGLPLPIFTGTGTFTGLFGTSAATPYLLLDALDSVGKPINIRFDFTPIAALGPYTGTAYTYAAIVENILPIGFPQLDILLYYAGFCEVALGANEGRSGGNFYNPAGSRWVGYQYAPYVSPPQAVPLSQSVSFATAAFILMVGAARLLLKPAPTPPQSPAPRQYTSYTVRTFRPLHATDSPPS
jgi:hypothetical protein